jgi:hypothetical protein
MPVVLLRLVEDRLRSEFTAVGQLTCATGRTCSVYAVASQDRTQVFDAARRIARLLLKPTTWVGLPSGHVTVLEADLDFLYAQNWG